MDDVTWAALTLTLTAVLGVGTWLAYQRRGLSAGLKGAGLTLLPLAAYLTDTLRMFTRITTAVGDWATGLVLSPTVWIGIVLAGLGVVLFGVGRAVGSRTGGRDSRRDATDAVPASRQPAASLPDGTSKKRSAGKPAERSAEKSAEPGEPEGMDEIEALLRKRGIT